MNNKSLLVSIITLLFSESLLSGSTDRSNTFARSILVGIKKSDSNVVYDPEGESLEALRQIALNMTDNPMDYEFEPTEFLGQLRVALGDDSTVYDSIAETVNSEIKESSLKRRILNIRRRLQAYVRDQRATEILNKAAWKVKFDREKIDDMKEFIAEVCAELEPYQQDFNAKDPAIVAEISLDEPESLNEVFRSVKHDTDGQGILKTGWQGLNRMIRGGFRRGEQTVIGALQHNFKTGFVLSLFRHFAVYNTPVMTDPTKKPLLALMSFENELTTNLHLLYKNLKENETLVEVTEDEIKNTPEAEMTAFIQAKLGVNGYHIKMIRVNPSLWSYLDICNKIVEWESEGFEIHACILDYLSMVPTTGCVQGTMGEDKRDLFRRIRNFMSAKKIAVITPHQLSTEAKQLIRDGRQNFVMEIANKGYYDGCRRLDQEVDLELYIHIEKVNGRSYLTIQRGKHRTVVGQTKADYLYTVLPFEDVGAIRDDVNGADTSRKKPGGGPIGSKDETPFWETDNNMATSPF